MLYCLLILLFQCGHVHEMFSEGSGFILILQPVPYNPRYSMNPWVCDYLARCLISGYIWTSKVINGIMNETESITYRPTDLQVPQYVLMSHVPRKRNKDPCGGINCKVKGVLVCQLCFKNFTLIFISTLSLGWLLSIIQYYCGRLLRGNIFKDSKSLKGQRKPLMLYSLF